MARYYDSKDVMRQKVVAPMLPGTLRTMENVKEAGQAFYDMLDSLTTVDGVDPRCIAIAKTHIEEAVMWAVKGLTA